MQGLLALIGLITCMGIFAMCMCMLWEGVSELIHKVKRNYKIKHRFDKPPTAACYCVDCVWYDGDNRCRMSGKQSYVRDNDFCSDARPEKCRKE